MLKEKLQLARELSWQHHGREVTFYLPGMFRLDGLKGRYPAISITGSECAFSCEHCQGLILNSMHQVWTPEILLQKCHNLKKNGSQGVLISGGCNDQGYLPWKKFADTLRRIKSETGLFVSVHVGFPNQEQAALLKDCAVDQALIDVIGDNDTLHRVYHAPFGTERIRDSLLALYKAGLPIVPHIVCGLHYGQIRGEYQALQMVFEFTPEQLSIVSLMNLAQTPMHSVQPPPAESVAEIIASARMLLPKARLSLGCARPRGDHRLEELALEAGVNRLALPSPEAQEKASALGLNIRYQQTCCSVSRDLSASFWPFSCKDKIAVNS